MIANSGSGARKIKGAVQSKTTTKCSNTKGTKSKKHGSLLELTSTHQIWNIWMSKRAMMTMNYNTLNFFIESIIILEEE